MTERFDLHRTGAYPRRVLIVGGYGSVGRRIAELLLATSMGLEVVLAGRNLERARKTAARFGDRSLPRRLDVADAGATREAFKATAAVVMTTEAHLQQAARIAIDAGVPLVSIAASVEKVRSLAELEVEAQAKKGVIVIDVGLAPGLMNAMAHDLLSKIDTALRLEFVLRLSVFGDHGPEAIRWTLDRAKEASGLETLFAPMSDGRNRGIRMDFVDLDDFLFPKSVASYLQLTPDFSMGLLPGSARHLRGLMSSFPAASAGVSKVLNLLGLRTDDVMLCVQAQTNEGLARSIMEGAGQAQLTAKLTAETLLRVLRGGVPGGVHKMETLLPFPEMQFALESEGSRFFAAYERL